MAHAGGRPRAFKSVEDIEAKIQLYKEYLKKPGSEDYWARYVFG